MYVAVHQNAESAFFWRLFLLINFEPPSSNKIALTACFKASCHGWWSTGSINLRVIGVKRRAQTMASVICCRSPQYRRKGIAPRIEPWGTPHTMELEKEEEELTQTCWSRLITAGVFHDPPCQRPRIGLGRLEPTDLQCQWRAECQTRPSEQWSRWTDWCDTPTGVEVEGQWS